MKIYFATKNKHKLEEARAVLKEFDIEVEQLAIDKNEEGDNIQIIASTESKRLSYQENKPIIVDDTGVFF